MFQTDVLKLVDVGAMGGLPPSLALYSEKLWPILFEPNPEEAEKLRLNLNRYKNYLIVEHALGDRDDLIQFTQTRNPTCSSVLKPNFEFLKHYGISYHFHIEQVSKIKVSRYDTLNNLGVVPTPDAIKIDVQGFEYQVLNGFGNLLFDVLAIKLETQFYEVYEKQYLFSDITSFLTKFGFVLRRIETDKIENFAGDIVEVEAYFTKSRREIMRADTNQRTKFDILTDIWQLPRYDFGLP
jgi:FkbM family methyltransferase